jgi:hypothetical protein
MIELPSANPASMNRPGNSAIGVIVRTAGAAVVVVGGKVVVGADVDTVARWSW